MQGERGRSILGLKYSSRHFRTSLPRRAAPPLSLSHSVQLSGFKSLKYELASAEIDSGGGLRCPMFGREARVTTIKFNLARVVESRIPMLFATVRALTLATDADENDSVFAVSYIVHD